MGVYSLCKRAQGIRCATGHLGGAEAWSKLDFNAVDIEDRGDVVDSAESCARLGHTLGWSSSMGTYFEGSIVGFMVLQQSAGRQREKEERETLSHGPGSISIAQSGIICNIRSPAIKNVTKLAGKSFNHSSVLRAQDS